MAAGGMAPRFWRSQDWWRVVFFLTKRFPTKKRLVKTFGRPCICSDYPWNHLPETTGNHGKINHKPTICGCFIRPISGDFGVSPSISAKKASMRTPPAAFAAEEMLCRCQRRHRKRPGFRMMVSNGVN